jgi:two-component system, OmpR family, response regulator
MASRVFLVEDSAATCSLLAAVLVQDGKVDIVGIAATEHEAIDWLDSHRDRWDIALVDLFLGEGSGVVVIEHCQQRRDDQSVLVMTNHSRNLDLLAHCKALGVDALYQKATELDQLVAYCAKPPPSNRQRAASVAAV